MKVSYGLKAIVPALSLMLMAGAASAQTDSDKEAGEGVGLATSTCNETVANRLESEYGIDWEAAEEKDVFPVSMGRESDMQTGYNYWIRPDDCSDGFLVIDVASSCAIRNVYTTGSCQVKGVPNYD